MIAKTIFDMKGIDDRVPKLIGNLQSFKDLKNFYVFDSELRSRDLLRDTTLDLEVDEYLLGGYPFRRNLLNSYIVTNKRILLVDFTPALPTKILIHTFISPLTGNPTPQIIENRFSRVHLGLSTPNSLGSVIILLNGVMFGIFQDNTVKQTWTFESSLSNSDITPVNFKCISETSQGFIIGTNGITVTNPTGTEGDITCTSLFLFKKAGGALLAHWFAVSTKGQVKACCKSGDNVAIISTVDVTYLQRTIPQDSGIQYTVKAVSDDVRLTSRKNFAIPSLYFSGVFFDGDLLMSVNAMQLSALQTALPRKIANEVVWGDGTTQKHLSFVGYNKDLTNNQMYLSIFRKEDENLNLELLVVSLDNGRVMSKYTHEEIGELITGFTGSLVSDTKILPYLIGTMPQVGGKGQVFVQTTPNAIDAKKIECIFETHVIYENNAALDQKLVSLEIISSEMDVESITIEINSNGVFTGKSIDYDEEISDGKSARIIIGIDAEAYLPSIKVIFTGVRSINILAMIIDVRDIYMVGQK